MQPTAGLRKKLKRYLLPTGLLVVPDGDLFVSRNILEANCKALKQWMPHYVRVHAVLAGSMLFATGSATAAEAPEWLVLATAVPAAGEIALVIVFAAMAFALRLR